MNEQEVIEQLQQYRQKRVRMDLLSTYSVGAGITISRLNQDDQLQELHKRLRGLPTYMYLSGYEQKLEATAHAYLEKYPAGIRSQLQALPDYYLNVEDAKLLRDLRGRIEKVFKARGYDVRDDLDEVLERVAELQDLQVEIDRIDSVLLALGKLSPEYPIILRRKYIDGELWNVIANDLQLSKPVFFRRRTKAIREYIKLLK